MEDLNPAPGLDEFLVPQNYSSASALETMTKSQLTLIALQAKANGTDLGDPSDPAYPKVPLALPAPTSSGDDVANTEDDEQADPAEQVVPEVNVAPPPGIVLPGTQPIDDSFFGRAKKVAEAQNAILSTAVRRILHTEADKVSRAVKKSPDNFPAWSEEFYGKHAVHVRAAMAPVVEAISASVLAVAPDASTKESRGMIDQFITAAVTKHIGESRADLTDLDGVQQRVAHWEEARSDAFAKSCIGELLDLLCLPEQEPHKKWSENE